jgi:phosphoadenosine phosphosulfate reductase
MSLAQKVRNVEALLQNVAQAHTPAAFANSFGAEDVVLTDIIARRGRDIEIFTLDTGRLHEATHALMRELADRYELPIRIYYPDAAELEAFTGRHGPNAFLDSIELRKACCGVRKVSPLRRALSGKRAWITGLRREQSPTRTDVAAVEYDNDFGLQKFNPLFDWTRKDVWSYIRDNDLPYNALHDQGFASIGCAPCTRSITVGEDERAGRWWWEDPHSKECGLHSGKAASTRVRPSVVAGSTTRSQTDEVPS